MKKSFDEQLEAYYPLEKCFFPNSNQDHKDIQPDLQKLRQIDPNKLFRIPDI